MIRGAVLLPWVIPTALSTLGWWWMFNSLYSVVNWTGIALGIMDPPGPELARAEVLRDGRGRSPSTSGAGCRSSPSPSWPGSSPSPRSSTRRPRPTAPAPMARFWYITLPLLKPVLAVVVLFSTIFTFSDFNIVYVLTNGGPINSTHLFATLSRQIGHRDRAASARGRRSRSTSSRCSPSWCGRSSASCGSRRTSMTVARRPLLTKIGDAPAAAAVPRLRAVPLLSHDADVAEDRTASSTTATPVPLVITQGPTLEHYTKLLWETEFLTWTKNSLLVTVAGHRGLGRHRHHRRLRARPAQVLRRWPPSAPASS